MLRFVTVNVFLVSLPLHISKKRRKRSASCHLPCYYSLVYPTGTTTITNTTEKRSRKIEMMEMSAALCKRDIQCRRRMSVKAWLLAAFTCFCLLSSSSSFGGVAVEAFGVLSPASARFSAPTLSPSSFPRSQAGTPQRHLQQQVTVRRGSTTTRRSTVLYRIRCENKYYQLEEMEDRENCTTELFLKEDGQVLIGETDGPLWTEAIGKFL